MAVARAPVGGGMTGIKVALIVFVVLTVASLAGTIIMFTYKSELEARAEDATKQAQTASSDAAKARQDASEIARLVTGESTSELDKIKSSIPALIAPMVKDPDAAKMRVAEDASVATVLRGLYNQYRSTVELLGKTTAERDGLADQLKKLTEASEQRAKDFEAKTNDFQQRIAALEQENAANQQAWTQQLAEVKQRLESSSASAMTSLGSEQKQREQLQKQLDEKNARLQELANKLSRFQPGAQVTAQQIADGRIVRAVPTEGIVYISLGKRDRITPGMPFSVYGSSPRADGVHEKATLEVVTVFDTTAEARVTSTKMGDPILENDLVANLIYDKNRQYRFVVAGNFDLDFDGKTDEPGGINGQDVARMIERWGGKVVDRVDSSVDFVVLGAPPMHAGTVPDGATDEVKERAAQQEQVRAAFDTTLKEARTLSIPIFTRTQFLHFIGAKLPPRTPDDQPAGQ